MGNRIVYCRNGDRGWRDYAAKTNAGTDADADANASAETGAGNTTDADTDASADTGQAYAHAGTGVRNDAYAHAGTGNNAGTAMTNDER
jgi:hypothetical protein